MRSRAEVEKMRRHLLEVSRSNVDEGGLVAAMAAFTADALSWVLLEPGQHPIPFADLVKQLDAAEGNTPN